MKRITQVAKALVFFSVFLFTLQGVFAEILPINLRANESITVPLSFPSIAESINITASYFGSGQAELVLMQGRKRYVLWEKRNNTYFERKNFTVQCTRCSRVRPGEVVNIRAKVAGGNLQINEINYEARNEVVKKQNEKILFSNQEVSNSSCTGNAPNNETWVVVEATFCRGGTIVVRNVTVNAPLTIEHLTLRFIDSNNATFEAYSQVAINNATVKATNEAGYRFIIHPSGSLNLSSSNISGAGPQTTVAAYQRGAGIVLYGTSIRIKNTSIAMANFSSLYGISLVNVSKVNIENVNVTVPSKGQIGFFMRNVNKSNITSVHIKTFGTGGYGVYAINTKNLSLNKVIVNTSGQIAEGIFLDQDAKNITLKNSSIIITGEESTGLYLYQAQENRVNQVNISAQGNTSVGVVIDYLSNANYFQDIKISVSHNQGRGIYFFDASNNTFRELWLQTTESEQPAIDVQGDSDKNSFVSTNVSGIWNPELYLRGIDSSSPDSINISNAYFGTNNSGKILLDLAMSSSCYLHNTSFGNLTVEGGTAYVTIPVAVIVNATNQSFVESAQVKLKNAQGSLLWNETTKDNGETGWVRTLLFTQESTTRINATPHTIVVTHPGFINATTSSNTENTTIIYVTMNKKFEARPDFQIASSFISIDSNTVEVGEVMQLSVSVKNIGFVDASSAEVVVLLNETELCRLDVYNLTRFNLVESETKCNITFSEEGLHVLSIIVDPENLFQEVHETNNQATFPVVVGGINDIALNTIMLNVSSVRLFFDQLFFAEGSVEYITTGDSAKGVEVRITFKNSTQTVVTDGEGNIPRTYLRSGSTSGIFALNASAWHQMKTGETSKTIEVLNRTALLQESNATDVLTDPLVGCPYTFPDPDLVIYEFPTESCIIYVNCTLTFAIQNNGCPNASNVSVQVQDIYNQLTVIEKEFSLVRGGGDFIYEFNATWRPESVGTYVFSMDVDPTNQIGELDETNNQINFSVVAIAQLPDLVTKRMSYTRPLRVNVSQNFTLIFENRGSINISDSFYIATYIDSVLVNITNFTRAVSAQTEQSSKIKLFFNDTAVHRIDFVLDYGSLLEEESESNNIMTTFVLPVFAPDVTIASLSIYPQGMLFLNDTLEISGTLQNIGNKNITDENVTVEIMINGATRNISEYSVLDVDTTINISEVINLDTAGETTITLCVNRNLTILEGSFGGVNCREESIFVHDPSLAELIIRRVGITAEPFFVNQQINQTFAVDNTGIAAASEVENEIIISIDDEVWFNEYQTISSSGNDTQSFITTTTPSSPGIHHVNVTVDPNETILEVNKENNKLDYEQFIYTPDLRITASDIYLSQEFVNINGNLTVISVVHNDGSVDAYNVSVILSEYGQVIQEKIVGVIEAQTAQAVEIEAPLANVGYQTISIFVNNQTRQTEYGNKKNNEATAIVYKKSCGGNCTNQISLNYPRGGENVSGVVNFRVGLRNEDNQTNESIHFSLVNENGTLLYLGNTSNFTGSLFTITGENATAEITVNTTTLDDGYYDFYVWSSSNKSSIETPKKVLIDNTAPVVSFGGVLANNQHPSKMLSQYVVLINETFTVDHVRLLLLKNNRTVFDGFGEEIIANEFYLVTISLEQLPGEYRYHAIATDVSGNNGSSTAEFSIFSGGQRELQFGQSSITNRDNDRAGASRENNEEEKNSRQENQARNNVDQNPYRRGVRTEESVPQVLIELDTTNRLMSIVIFSLLGFIAFMHIRKKKRGKENKKEDKKEKEKR